MKTRTFEIKYGIVSRSMGAWIEHEERITISTSAKTQAGIIKAIKKQYANLSGDEISWRDVVEVFYNY